MKTAFKVIKVIGIVLLVIVILVVGGAAILLGVMNERNTNYWKYAEPSGELEAKYTALGSYDVSAAEFDAGNEVYGKFEVWYPTELTESDRAYPLVVMANGTGTKASSYASVFKHLASWGFIVVGNEDENSRSGASSAATLDFMLSLNADSGSDFFGHIDAENIGIAGHSQGGVGAVNAVTQQENGMLYKAICAESATSSALAYALNQLGDGWSCDTSALNIPCFLLAGTGGIDAGNVDEYRLELEEGETQGICPLWWLNTCYDAISDSNAKVIARQVGKDHGDIPRSAGGYLTAWFLYWLQGDAEAGNAFFGENAEILTNESWQDVRINP